MSEIIFVVEEAAEGGYSARAVGESIFTQADDLARLQEQVRDAVRCHFEDGKTPKLTILRTNRQGSLPRTSTGGKEASHKDAL